MRKIKYIIFAFLILLGFIFNGEIYILYMENFQESYYTADFYYDKINTIDEYKADFLEASKKTKTNFFMLKENINSTNEKELVIYGTKPIKKYLKESGVHLGTTQSIFSGNLRTKFIEIKDIKKLSEISELNNIYFPNISNLKEEDFINSIREFKTELVSKYDGGFPRVHGSELETYLNIGFIWIIIFLFILLLTIYQINMQKKKIL